MWRLPFPKPSRSKRSAGLVARAGAAPSQGPAGARTILAELAAVLFCLGMIAFWFLLFLTAWGLAAAPFVRLKASWPVLCGAFVLSALLTGRLYRRHLSRFFSSRP